LYGVENNSDLKESINFCEKLVKKVLICGKNVKKFLICSKKLCQNTYYCIKIVSFVKN